MPGIIFKTVDGKTVLQPDWPGTKPGDPLKVKRGDFVTWNNRTNEIHHPVAITPAGLFLTDEIPPGRVSSPIFNVTQSPSPTPPPTTITYMCSHHPDNPDERGSIEVI
jgi:hypothetical protein